MGLCLAATSSEISHVIWPFVDSRDLIIKCLINPNLLICVYSHANLVVTRVSTTSKAKQTSADLCCIYPLGIPGHNRWKQTQPQS